MSPNRTLRTGIRLLGACALAITSLSACGSDAADTNPSTETTVAAAETTADATTETTPAVTETSAAAAETAPPVADSVSGDTVGAESADATEAAATGAAAVQGVILTDGEAPAERTITVVGQAFQPNTLTVKVGDTVTFKAGDKQISSVIVGDLPGATVTGGLIETFQFSIPGSLPGQGRPERQHCDHRRRVAKPVGDPARR